MFGNFGPTPSFGSAFSGAAPTNNVFGQPQQQTSPSLFGGGFNQTKPTFGTSFGTPQSTSTMFGQPNRLPGATAGIFSGGNTATVSPFSSSTGQTQIAGTSVAFNAITGTDTMMRNGVASPINTRHQCITCMKEYENKSLEELRLEDYQLNRKGPGQNSIFGGTQPQQSAGIFSSMGANTGSPSSFGQASATFGTGSTGGVGLFSNLNQKPAPSFFTNPTTSTSAFGGGASAFSFNNPTSQPGSIFGSNNNTTSTAGTLSSFTFNQQQQQQQQPQGLGGSLFGAKPMTAPATSTASGFGFGTSTNNNATIAKPVGIFGTGTSTSFGTGTSTSFGTGSTPAFGAATGGLFGNQSQQPQQQKPFSFGNTFGAASTNQSTFGAPGGTGSFSFSTPASTTSLPFGNTPAPTFGTGGVGATSFGSFGNTQSFSLGGAPTSTGFGANSFSFSPAASTTGFSMFTPSISFTQPSQQQITAATGPVPFATTPYKDSPLFYNLITNRNLDDLTRPTNPMAQRAIKEASRRKTSTSLNTSGSSGVKNLTFPVTKNQPFSKFSIFDGFEEDDQGTAIDILSPKTSVKKLSLKNIKPQNHRYSFSPPNRARNAPPLTESPRFEVNNSRANDTFDVSSASVGLSSGGYCKDTVPMPGVDFLYEYGENSVHRRSGDPDVSSVSTMNGGDTNLHGSGVICTRPGYYIHPSAEDLDVKTDELGNCLVKGFVVGRYNYGMIRFPEVINVAGINIDEIVLFRHKEVVVYPDDNSKPPIGEGLNCPAVITMERVWPIDKVTKDPIKSPPKVKAMNYEDKLRKACLRMDSEFVVYTEDTGIWAFRVKHFSKYSCEPEENEEDDEAIAPAQVLKGKGLGGISSQQLKTGLLNQSSLDSVTQDPLSTAGINVMLAPKVWMGSNNDSDLRVDMPVFHTLMSTNSAPKKFQADEVEDEVENDNELSVTEGEIEHNPLTPSESEDSDKGVTVGSSEVKKTHYESVFGENKPSDKVRMMKSFLSLDPLNEEDTVIELQPPFKRSRQPAYNTGGSGKMMFTSCNIDTKNVEDSYFKKPKSSRLRKTVTKTNVPSQTNFLSALKNKSKPATSESLQFTQKPTKTDPFESNIASYNFMELQCFSAPAQILKRNEIQFESSHNHTSLFSKLLVEDRRVCKRGGARVSFGSSGYFLHVVNGAKNLNDCNSFRGLVNIKQIQSYACGQTEGYTSCFYLEAIDQQMKLQLGASYKDLNVLYSESVIPQHVTLLRSLLREPSQLSGGHIEILTHEVEMWKLCEILWPTEETDNNKIVDEGFVLNQRERFSIWLKINAAMLFGGLYNADDTSLIGLLNKGMKLEACQLAVVQRNYTIALNLSQWRNGAQEIFRGQFKAWKDNGTLDFVPTELLNIYRICCGNPIWEDIDVTRMNTSQWWQQFSIYLWYLCPPHLPIDEVVLSFQAMLKRRAVACGNANAYICFPYDCDSTIPNLCIHILKAYSCTGYPLKNLYNPRSNNPDCLDYKLSFLLMTNLYEFGYISDTETYESICSGFASQLEQLGLYRWSIFVLKHLPGTASREMIIRRILEKNLKSGNDMEGDFFLAVKLDILSYQLFSVKALKSSMDKKRDYQVWYLLRSEQYEEAYKIFVHDLFMMSMICPKNDHKILEILESMHLYADQIPQWCLHGQFVQSYLKLQQYRDAYLNVKSEFPFDPSEVQKHVTDFLSAFVRFKPSSAFESAFLLELALSAQKIVQLLLMDSRFTNVKTRNAESNLSTLMKLPVPNEYMNGVQNFVASWLAA